MIRNNPTSDTAECDPVLTSCMKPDQFGLGRAASGKSQPVLHKRSEFVDTSKADLISRSENFANIELERPFLSEACVNISISMFTITSGTGLRARCITSVLLNASLCSAVFVETAMMPISWKLPRPSIVHMLWSASPIHWVKQSGYEGNPLWVNTSPGVQIARPNRGRPSAR